MKKVFITNYNLKNIVGEVHEEFSEDILSEVLPLLNDLKASFSTVELSRIYLIFDLINDGNFWLKQMKSYKPTKLDGAAYHSSSDCKELNKNYLDVIWDTDEREQVKLLERELSNIYNNIIYGDLSDREVDLPIPQHLMGKYGAHGALITIRKNSGHILFKNQSKSDVISDIKDELLRANHYRFSSGDEVQEEINNFTYGTDRWRVVKNRPTKTMEVWKGFKDRIMDLLIIYLRLKSSGSTDERLLDKLNLHPCKSCFSETSAKSSNDWIREIWDWADKYNISDATIPRTTDSLINLTHLEVRDFPHDPFSSINELPNAIGNLTNLKTLDLSVSIKTIPSSIGNLIKLETLKINGFFHMVPDSLGNLRNLKVLRLESGLLKELPSTIGQLKSLKKLMIGSIYLERFPETVGSLTNLEELSSPSTGLSALKDFPLSLVNLVNLQSIRLLRLKSFKNQPEIISSLVNKSLSDIVLTSSDYGDLPDSVKENYEKGKIFYVDVR